MEWSVDTDEKSQLLTVTVRGTWEISKGIEAIAAVREERTRTGSRSVVWDCRETMAEGVATSGLRDLAFHQLGNEGDLPESRAAIVVPGDLEFGLGRMLEAFLASGSVDVQVFRDLDEAKAWLAEGLSASQ